MSTSITSSELYPESSIQLVSCLTGLSEVEASVYLQVLNVNDINEVIYSYTYYSRLLMEM